MAKKNQNQNIENKEQKQENYYELKTDAVDRLVNADSLPRPKLTTDPARDFRSKGFLDKIPVWVKALFIKFWFNGAVCFFIFWGLGTYITDNLDMLVVFGIVLGVVTDVLVNNTFRFIEVYPGQNSKWMMFPKKKLWTFFANILYACVVLFCVFMIYNGVNIMIQGITGNEGEITIGVEPIAFGLLYLLIDLSFISIKNMLVSIVTDAMKKNER